MSAVAIKPNFMKFLITILLISVVPFPSHYGFQHVGRLANFLPVSWDSTKNWKLYRLANFQQVFRIPSDSLQNLKSRPLNDDSVHQFLSNAKKLQNINPVWMGCYLASYQSSDGKLKKAIISHYAGFFYCQWEKSYYQLDPAQQQDWLSYLSAAYTAIETEVDKK